MITTEDKALGLIPFRRFPREYVEALATVARNVRESSEYEAGKEDRVVGEVIGEYRSVLQEHIEPAALGGRRMSEMVERAVPEMFEPYPPFLQLVDLDERYDIELDVEEPIPLADMRHIYYTVHTYAIIDLLLGHLTASGVRMMSINVGDYDASITSLYSPYEKAEGFYG